MKKLFFTRLILYTAAAALPVIHPAVAVSYDRVGLWTYFIIVPLAMLLGFYVKRPGFSFKAEFAWPLGMLVVLLVFAVGVDRQSLILFVAFLYSYISTRLVFAETGRGSAFAAIELFLLGGIYYSILNFSRSSEELAVQSSQWTSFLVIFGAAAFCIHAIVLYLAAFPDRSVGRKRKELSVLAGILFFIGLPLAILLPSDYFEHSMVLNQLEKEPPLNPSPLDGNQSDKPGMTGEGNQGGQSRKNTQNGKPLGDRPEKFPSQLQGGEKGGGGQMQDNVPEGESQENPQPGGGQGNQKNQQGKGQNQKQDGKPQSDSGKNGEKKQNKQPGLEGVPADQWDQMQSSRGETESDKQNEGNGNKENQKNKKGGAGGKQQAVMIIASPVNPVYAAEEYLGDFDEKKGFLTSESILLNRLTRLRLLESWKNLEANNDLGRESFDIFYLSTLKERVVAYKPAIVEPTVLDKRYHPFDLSYNSKSLISVTNPTHWADITDLSFDESKEYEKFLEVKLPQKERHEFEAHLKQILGKNEGYFERINAILNAYKTYQYEIGVDDDMTVEKVRKFLFESKTGDCSEFAHSTALLARLAGIPARVVNGYIASKDLQTPAHVAGAKHLRKTIKPLQKFPLEQIYLVTSAHRHVWVQLYMPGFGWVDFETTSYAKPPKPEMNANNRDVVIPLIEEKDVPRDFSKFKIPWKFLMKALAFLSASGVMGMYLFRYGREYYFKVLSLRMSHAGLSALYSYLLMRLAANGYPLKEPWKTPKEYAQSDRSISDFAELYTMLRFRENYEAGEKEKAWETLREAVSRAVNDTKKPGFYGALKRAVSLRGLYY